MLLEHCDPWLEARSATFRKFGKNCLISDQCTFESLVPTVTPESADAPLDPAFRSVCVCVYVCEGVCVHFALSQSTKPSIEGKEFPPGII